MLFRSRATVTFLCQDLLGLWHTCHTTSFFCRIWQLRNWLWLTVITHGYPGQLGDQIVFLWGGLRGQKGDEIGDKGAATC